MPFPPLCNIFIHSCTLMQGTCTCRHHNCWTFRNWYLFVFLIDFSTWTVLQHKTSFIGSYLGFVLPDQPIMNKHKQLAFAQGLRHFSNFSILTTLWNVLKTLQKFTRTTMPCKTINWDLHLSANCTAWLESWNTWITSLLHTF